MINRPYQPAFTSGELSPALCARVDLQKYDSGAKSLINVEVRPEGGAARTPGTRFIADSGAEGPVRLIPFVFSVDQSYVLEFSPFRLRVITARGVVLDENGQPLLLETPYAAEDLFALSYAQNADVLYLAHADYAPRKLMRRDHACWELAQLDFAPKIPAPQGLQGRWSVGEPASPTRTWRYQVTALDSKSGEESLPSPVLEVPGSESMRVGILANGAPIADWFVRLSWQAVPGADEYRIYKESSSGSGLYGYIGSALNCSFADRNIGPRSEETPPVNYNPLIGNNPACVAIHQQRLVFANSKASPGGIWMSRTGNFENFGKSARIKADDCLELRLASGQVNPIVWLVGLRELVAGTSGAVWGLQGASGGGALAPGAVRASLQNARGSAAGLRPVVIDNSILHVDRNSNAVRDLQYSFNSDSYRGSDRSLFASHLFAGRSVADLAYQESPYSIVWFVMDDGLLLGLTWVLEHDIYAWHRHCTAGAYESVCVVPGRRGDETFFVVRREINGQNRRYIEKLDQRFSLPENYAALDDQARRDLLAEAFFVHSGLSYQGPPLCSFGGLEHLEGQEVAILADGAVHPPLRVHQGRVQLNAPAGRVHIGLPYRSLIESVSFEPDQQNGTAVGRRKRVARLAVDFQAACCVEVGINGQGVEVKSRSSEPYGLPPRLRNGVAVYSVPGVWGPQSRVSISSSAPAPFTVLALAPELSIDSRG